MKTYRRNNHRLQFGCTIGCLAVCATPIGCSTQAEHQHQRQEQHWLLRQRRVQDSTNTCTIDGIIFEQGDNLGDSFITRCGSALDWPCYCSPGKNPPIECPYCSMADLDEGLVCARDGETVTITNLNGIAQTCSCNISSVDGTPQESCTDPVNDSVNNGDEFCSIRIFDGTIMAFENGESLGEFLPTRCPGGGSEYPCYCNTAIADQVDCPYCTFVDYRGDLVCAREKESIIYENAPGEFLECGCLSGLISSCKLMAPTTTPVEISIPTNRPTTPRPTPTIQPTGSPITIAPTSIMTDPETTAPSITETSEPTVTPSANENTPQPTAIEQNHQSTGEPSFYNKDDQLESELPPLDEPKLDGCLIPSIDDKGSVHFVAEGDSFGSTVEGPCSPNEDWPVLCNPAIPDGGAEYPYCVFETFTSAAATRGTATQQQDDSKSDIICAHSGERVSVTHLDGTTQECSCLYFNPLLGPTSSCPMVQVNLSLPPLDGESATNAGSNATFPPTTSQTSSDGERNEASSATSVTRRSGIQISLFVLSFASKYIFSVFCGL